MKLGSTIDALLSQDAYYDAAVGETVGPDGIEGICVKVDHLTERHLRHFHRSF